MVWIPVLVLVIVLVGWEVLDQPRTEGLKRPQWGGLAEDDPCLTCRWHYVFDEDLGPCGACVDHDHREPK